VRVTPNCDSINSIVISAATNIQFMADATFGGGNYMVVWTDYRSGSAYQIYGSRVSAAGTVLDPSGIELGPSTAASYQYYPSVGYNGTRYFVVWGYYSSPYAVTGRFVNTNGTLYGDTIRIASATSYVYGTRIAYDGTNFMIAYVDYGNGTNCQLKGIRVAGATGTPIGSAFTIADSIYYYQSIGLSFANSRYLAIYCRLIGSYYQMMGRYYTTGGAPMGAAFNITNNSYSCYYGDVVAGPSGRYLNLWTEYRSTYDIYGNVDIMVGLDENATGTRPTATPLSTIVRKAIELKGAAGREMRVYDAGGRFMGKSLTGRFDVSALECGVYLVCLPGGEHYKVVKVQ
jgi:hypothetical protein